MATPEEITKDTVVGFIGLGVMGLSMAGHLQKAGCDLHVYTRSPDKGKTLLDAGATWHEEAMSLAASCDIVVTMVGYPSDVEEVYLGANGLVTHGRPGSVFIDMTTSQPALAKKIFEAASERGIDVLDAPVSGGDIGARDAKLSIMVGGEKSTFEAMSSIFTCMGKNVVYQGEAGAGQHAKMCNQIAIASGMMGVCEAVAYAVKSGLDPHTVLKSIAHGAAGSWALLNLAPRMIDGDKDPGFYVKHFIKDMDIAIAEAKAMELQTPGLSLARSLYERLVKDYEKEGASDWGTQALYKIFEG